MLQLLANFFQRFGFKKSLCRQRFLWLHHGSFASQLNINKIMKTQKIISVAASTFIGFSAFSIIMVSLMAFSNPQKVMDLVNVKLTNNDAYSSIRGVYGGVGLTIFIVFVYLGFRDQTKGLIFAAVLWGLYAISRLITIMSEGPLGDFGNQWLTIESILCIVALVLLSFKLRLSNSYRNANSPIL
jgi:divalent metal cation (Fe/Co/Zn/Cd) transporter